MKIVKGNVFDSKDDVILVSANSVLNSKNELVMGKGAALELAIKNPQIPIIAGRTVTATGPKYGIIVLGKINPTDTQIFGLFQTKYNFASDSDLDLIRFSVDELNKYSERHPNFKISINFPGIGNGKLYRKDVLPIIQLLNDRITVYEIGSAVLDSVEPVKPKSVNRIEDGDVGGFSHDVSNKKTVKHDGWALDFDAWEKKK